MAIHQKALMVCAVPVSHSGKRQLKKMAQPASLDRNLPDLGGPFLYRNQDRDGEKAPYSLETPYGFLLDLDFLKYVDDIERGQTLRKLPLQRKTKGSKQGLSSSHGRTGGWTSTESLSSVTSEDGKPAFSPRTKLWASSSEIREPTSKQASLPLSPALQLLPPPSPKSRVEKTLLETSKRLEEEQRSVTARGTPSAFETPSSPSKVNASWTYASGESHIDPSVPIKMSPSNSGRSTPAAAVSPAHLHHVREQMAAALKQLKELEEQVKVIPVLELQICKLKKEKEELVSGTWGKRESDVGEGEIFCFPPRSPKGGTIGMDGGGCQDIHEEHAEAENMDGPPKPRTSKIAGLKKLTEKLSGSERAGKMGRGSTRPSKAEESLHKSVAVGEEVDMNEAVFYYRCQRSQREVAVGRELETQDAEVWVMESLLGVSSEAEKELQFLQQTVQHQREVIAMLEGHLKEATDELEELRIEVCARMPRNQLDKETMARPETVEACVDAVPVMQCQAVGRHTEMVDKGVHCSPHVACVGVGCDLQQECLTSLRCCDKATQMETEREYGASGGHICGQEPGMDTDAPEDGKLRKPSQSLERESAKQTLQMEISGLDQELCLISEPSGKDEETVLVIQRKTEKSSEHITGAGGLRSIMKKQDSLAKMEAGTGRKTLQFVGVLNGEYESTSSEEEEEEEEEEEDVETKKRSPLSSETDTDGSTDSSDGDFATRTGGPSNCDPGSTYLDQGKLGCDPEEAAEGGKNPVGVADPTVKEKFELSPRMREACLLLRSHLSRGGAAPKSKEMLSATGLVLQEWFRVSSQKASLADEVADHLLAFAEISPALLSHVINLSDGNGNTALHYSVSHSNFDIVQLLLDTGVCNVNHQNKAGYTALMLAALASVEQEADMAIVQRLFSMGNVNAKASQAGQTALMLAVSHGRQEMVEVLLACGADTNLQDEEGSTALMCACEHGRAGTVRLLLSQPACDVSIVDHDGNDAVSIALEAGHRDIAALISTRLTHSLALTLDDNGKSPCSDNRPL
ncbi:KN motif and ankyrin repeat domain-containing protein 3 isoform X2 [Sceloporus undulatus]|uniref:KN motif and ankyrin repeat domain-containing protein 3 isoform X2 n=1 Tax=Sceloporus undulatus TaxID=8520 RepID=UPI001C4B5555|nr:KN motif and ankyrin repeat domain-containing protein 3 isoform X2 [Sceloporus undulatus]